MAETKLEEEVDVIVVQNSEYENENENENEYSDVEMANVQTIWSRYSDNLPGCMDATEICDYDSSWYITEAFEEMAQDEGDVDELTFNDLDNYLDRQGTSLRDYGSVMEIADRAADKQIEDELWDYKEEILKYYAIYYYDDTYSSEIIPVELAEIIDDNSEYRSFDRLGEIEDMIDEWMSDHEGILEHAE